MDEGFGKPGLRVEKLFLSGFNLRLGNGDPGNGRSRIDDDGTAAFETITFANPTTALSVNAGDGDDDITLLGLDDGFAASVTLDGQEGSDDYTVNFGTLGGPVTVADTGPAPPGDTDSLLVNGTPAADTIVVTATAVTRDATPDETVNYAGIEEVTVTGGTGDDDITITSSAPGTLTVDGQAGSDTYTVNFGSLAGDVTVADSGPPPPDIDTLVVNGTPGDDTIILTDSGVTGGGGAGITFSGIEAFAVDAGAGDDLVDGSALTIPVTIFGGTGDDTLIGGSGDDSLFGEEDDDDLIGGLGADLLDGGAGSDGLVGDLGTILREVLDGSTAAVLATPNRHLQAEINQAGTIRREVTLVDPEQGGADTMLGGTGNDSLHGGAGNDEMDGGDDDDALFGDLGDDSMLGGGGSDHLFGGRGDDSLDGGTGADIAYGGAGDDRLIADSPDDRLIDWFGNFNDFVVPGPSYGGPTIVRSPSPWVRQFLLDLALADGALDPNGEIAVVVPGSPDQQDNSGKGGRVK
jgi:Ca2+-binding RTX toxin-like protein